VSAAGTPITTAAAAAPAATRAKSGY
jgi:hypothetical protein